MEFYSSNGKKKKLVLHTLAGWLDLDCMGCTCGFYVGNVIIG